MTDLNPVDAMTNDFCNVCAELTDAELANAAKEALDSYRYATELPYFLREDSSEYEPLMLAIRAAIAADRAQWGADQELEACCEWLFLNGYDNSLVTSARLRNARRPKPLSLKEQALKELRQLPIDPELGVCASALDTIRRALEALND